MLSRYTLLPFVALLALGSVQPGGAHDAPAARDEQPGAVTPVAAGDAQAARQEQAARSYFTDLELVTQDGQRVRFYTDVLKGKVVLINFVYTHCKDACPLLTRKLTLVRDLVEGQLGNPIQFVTISLEPARDSPATLKKFARRHEADHPGWVFLTGQPNHVNQIIRKLGQYSPDLESHSTVLLAGNVRTAHWMKIPPHASPTVIAEKLRLLVEDS